MLSPSSAQMGGFRGLPSQVRGFGGQDVRFEDRVPYESRTLSVPIKKKNKKKSAESVEAREVHMEEVSKDKLQQRLVDKEQPDADTCTLSIN